MTTFTSRWLICKHCADREAALEVLTDEAGELQIVFIACRIDAGSLCDFQCRSPESRECAIAASQGGLVAHVSRRLLWPATRKFHADHAAKRERAFPGMGFSNQSGGADQVFAASRGRSTLFHRARKRLGCRCALGTCDLALPPAFAEGRAYRA